MMHRYSSSMRQLVLALLVAAPVAAQGVVSVQGFGYPPGQLSAGALGIQCTCCRKPGTFGAIPIASASTATGFQPP